MPNWKKLITSGSDASLASLVVTNAVTASALSAGATSITGTLDVSSDVAFDTDGFFFDQSTGRVGIGTTNPSSLLHLSGSGGSDYILTIVNAAPGGDYILIKGDQDNTTFELISGGTGGEAILNMFRDGTKYIQLSTDAGVNSYINNENFGIGTSDPVQRLTVNNGGSAASGSVIALTNSDTSITADQVVGTVEFGPLNESSLSSTYTPLAAIKNIQEDLDITGTASIRGALTFHTNYTNSMIERMRINSLGNVGIGTATPSSVLHISGAVSSGTELLTIQNATNQGGAAIKFIDDSVSSQPGMIIYRHADALSQGGGSSFHLTGEPDNVLIIGDGTNGGRVVVKSLSNVNEVDYGFYNDVDTGMYRSAADTLNLVTGGTTALSINSSQNATFAGDLTLSAGDVNVASTYKFESGNNYFMPVGAGGDMFIYQANTGADMFISSGRNILFTDNGFNEVSRFDTSGNFLLGATSTSNNAQFYATKTYSNASGTDQHVRIAATQDTASTGGIRNLQVAPSATHTSGTVADLIAVRPFVTVSGVGGTTTDAVGVDIGASVSVGATATNLVGLKIGSFGVGGSVSNRWSIYSEETAASYFAGDVRIGTTSATSHGEEVLHAYGSSGKLISVQASDSGAAKIHFSNSTTGAGSSDGFEIGLAADESVLIFQNEANTLRFGTAATERFRVASDAYAIGIGTTDVESWSTSFGAIEFGAASIMGSNTIGSLYQSSNAYYDGSWKRKNASGNPVQYVQVSGQHEWRTAASGTADSTISWSERMRLTNAGMLLVGDTANTGMTVGLTINQGGNDDEILALKSSDVAHGLTTNAETDTWLSVRKFSGTGGGARIRSFYEDVAGSTAMAIESFGGTADSTKSSSGRALLEMYVAEHDGANSFSNITADGNVFGVRGYVGGSASTLFLIDEDGDTWQSGGATINGALEVIGSGSTVLDIQGSQGQLFSVTDDLTGTLFSVNDISGIPILSVRDDDYVSIGTFNDEGLIVSGSEVYAGTLSAGATTVTGDLDVSGTVRATGDVIAYYSSDERLKTNVERIENPLEKVSKLGGYSYNWNDKQSTYPTGTKDVGIIAQEVKEVLEEAVTEREDGYLAVKYEKIIPLLIESVNELKKELDYLKNNCQCSKK